MSAYNSIIAREEYDLAKLIFLQSGFSEKDPGFRMTPGDLILQQPLENARNVYRFPVLSNDFNLNGASLFNTEIRLQQQDTIVVTQIGIFLCNPTGSTDGTYNYFTYPNPFIFTNAAQMQAIYTTGRMNLTINNDVWIKQYMLQRHYLTNQTQQTAALGGGSPKDQLNGMEDAFFPMTPMFFLRGTSDIQLTVSLAVAPITVDANSRLAIVLRGYIAQSTTSVQ